MNAHRPNHLTLVWLLGCTLLLALPSARAEFFALHVHESPADIAARTDAKTGPGYWAAFAGFGDKLKAAGILRGGAAFRTGDTVHTVQLRGGRTTARPGAYLPSADFLGGYFIIEVATLDEALGWAAQVPSAATGAVEVRSYYPVPGMQ